jgi:NAD(P)-dependent dehydrogenase (short-subunit alcohol dehydrogenase family)
MRTEPDHGEDTYKGSGRLEGKRAIITGGDSGIGRAVAIAFAREGADVVISYLESEEKDAQVTAQWVEKAGARRCSHRETSRTSRCASRSCRRRSTSSAASTC